jgi:hypothetical protein
MGIAGPNDSKPSSKVEIFDIFNECRYVDATEEAVEKREASIQCHGSRF